MNYTPQRPKVGQIVFLGDKMLPAEVKEVGRKYFRVLPKTDNIQSGREEWYWKEFNLDDWTASLRESRSYGNVYESEAHREAVAQEKLDEIEKDQLRRVISRQYFLRISLEGLRAIKQIIDSDSSK